jgi:hypothetical protein
MRGRHLSAPRVLASLSQLGRASSARWWMHFFGASQRGDMPSPRCHHRSGGCPARLTGLGAMGTAEPGIFGSGGDQRPATLQAPHCPMRAAVRDERGGAVGSHGPGLFGRRRVMYDGLVDRGSRDHVVGETRCGVGRWFGAGIEQSVPASAVNGPPIVAGDDLDVAAATAVPDRHRVEWGIRAGHPSVWPAIALHVFLATAWTALPRYCCLTIAA